MKKLLLIKFVFLLVFISGCQTINEKSEEIAKKENEKLSKFIGQPESELKIVMGSPDEETKDAKGAKILIYKTKKYGMPCERRFEVNAGGTIIAFSSSGCF